MLIKNYKRTKCPFGCNLFNDESNYHYWEDKKVTSDEIINSPKRGWDIPKMEWIEYNKAYKSFNNRFRFKTSPFVMISTLEMFDNFSTIYFMSLCSKGSP